jgi:hypothetical protein
MTTQQAATHRANATALFSTGQPHQALHEMSKATRIETWLDMQKGNRPHLTECVRQHPKQIKPPLPEPISLTRGPIRRYILQYVPRHDPRIHQAMEAIINHKPTNKPLPVKLNWGTTP